MTTDAELVRQARETLGISRESFGELIGVNRRTIQRWENGENPLRPGTAALIERLVKSHAHTKIEKGHLKK